MTNLIALAIAAVGITMLWATADRAVVYAQDPAPVRGTPQAYGLSSQAVEVLALRTENVKHFRNPDGSPCFGWPKCPPL